MNLGMKLIDAVTSKNSAQLATEALQRAKHEEAKVGGLVFGEPPKGMTRDFFCLDERTWVLHETWKEGKKLHERTLRYVIRERGIFRSMNGTDYRPVTREEGSIFLAAIERYNRLIAQELRPVLVGAGIDNPLY